MDQLTLHQRVVGSARDHDTPIRRVVALLSRTMAPLSLRRAWAYTAHKTSTRSHLLCWPTRKLLDVRGVRLVTCQLRLYAWPLRWWSRLV